MALNIEGSRCLITGAGRGAGLGIASVLAEHGANLALCDLDPDSARAAADTVASHGVKSIAIQGDVSNEDDVRRTVDRTVAELGGLDILVNTVAWIDPPGPIVDTPYERWQQGIRINLDSVFLCSKYSLSTMREQRSGLIINVSSLNGTRGFPNRAVYGATKAAILNLTETISMENRSYGIRANCLVPGAISGGRRLEIMRELAAQQGISRADVPTFDPPLRMTTPEALGAYVVFLASDAGGDINGQALVMGEAPRSGGQVLL